MRASVTKYMRLSVMIFIAIIAGTVGGIVFAQLGDTQTASGSVNVASTSADLYICEPGSALGPACGPDDSGADEIVFEGLENLRPGQNASYDIRLLNIGTVDMTISSAFFSRIEVSDPDNDCPLDAIFPASDPRTGINSIAGLFILGKLSDSRNDNFKGSTKFEREGIADSLTIFIAAGDYEDVRLRVTIPLGLPECEANVWDVFWTIEAL